jgi:hypothetical protein
MKRTGFGIAMLVVAGCTTKPEPEAREKPAPEKPRAEQTTPEKPAPDHPALGSGVSPGAEARSEGQGKGTTPVLSETVEYWDGATRRRLWLSDDTIAEFAPSDAGGEAIHLADPLAQELEQPQKGVRLWKLSKGLRPDAVASVASASPRRMSPLLHEGPSPKLPMRALPGGVIVRFPAGWDRARIDSWLATRKMHVQGDAIVAEANMFLVATPPGLEALRVADALHDCGELVDVTPNFWLQNATR